MLYCLGQNDVAGQHTRYGATVAPHSTSWLRHAEPFKRSANPEEDAAMVGHLVLTRCIVLEWRESEVGGVQGRAFASLGLAYPG